VEEYLPECIESIQNQIYKNLEIILIDDGSTDDSGQICDDYKRTDERIRVIHQANRGLMRTREVGIAAAEGVYLTFVDGDDWIDPDTYANLVPYMENADLVCSGYFHEIKLNQVVDKTDAFSEGLYSGKRLKELLSRFLFDFEKEKFLPLIPTVCTKIFRTELMKEIEFYKDYNISFCEDLVLQSQYIMRCHSIYICKNSYYHYRYRQSSICHAGNKQYLFDLAHTYLALEKIFLKGDDGCDLMKQLRKVISFHAAKTSDMMFADPEVRQMSFILDTSDLRGKKLVLFGAGRCGQDFFKQLKAFGIPVEKWFDSRPCMKFGQTVEDVNNILQWDFDLVLIAILDRKTASEMREQLLRLNVPAEKICWRQPLEISPY